MNFYLKLVDEIVSLGKVSLDEFIEKLTLDEEFGYYKKENKNILGKGGDFITAPEVSQIFGELIAVWFLYNFKNSKLVSNAKKLNLVEFGAGNGTLMSDILRVFSKNEEFYSKISKVYILDSSEYFIKKQKSILKEFADKVIWISDFSEIEKEKTLFIANEFFDALPIKQFLYKYDNWFERCVDVKNGDELFLSTFTNKIEGIIPLKDPENNDVYEYSPASVKFIKKITKHISQYKGLGIIIDYGYVKSPRNSTLQSVKDHKYNNIFDNLGDADITALVNFPSLIKNVIGCKTSLKTQGDFLRDMGIALRAEALKKQKNQKMCEQIDVDVHRLTSASEMGELFKVMMFADESFDELY